MPGDAIFFTDIDFKSKLIKISPIRFRIGFNRFLVSIHDNLLVNIKMCPYYRRMNTTVTQ